MKLSDLTDQQWFNRLSARRLTAAHSAKAWWAYYDGNQPMYHLLRILEQQDNRFPALTINWAQRFADTVDDRCFVEGFTFGGNDSPDEALWQTWQRNDMSEYQSENNVASLVTGTSYMMVGPSDEGALLTVESPESMAVEIDQRTRRVVAALKFYRSDAESLHDDRAVLLLPGRLVEFEFGKPVGGEKQAWMDAATRLQSSPQVPVVPFPNRQRQRQGRSELTPIVPLVDNANIVATSMMASVIHHAMPRMLAVNVAESLFLNEDGTPNKEAISQATGSVWILPAETDDEGKTLPTTDMPEADVKQLPASDLRNFHETLASLGRITAGLCGLPPHVFGFDVSDNPASADGIRAAENALVSRVERLQIARGNGYERVMRLAMAVEGRDPAAAQNLETEWRSASTPTEAAKADAAVKLYGANVLDLEETLNYVGLSKARKKSMLDRMAQAGSDPALAGAVSELQAARDAAMAARDAAVNGVADAPSSGA